MIRIQDLREKGEPSARSAPAPLPCLNRNNCTESPLSKGLNLLSTAHRKTAYALSKNVARLCSKYGIQRIGFLTLTFADHVTCAKEAGRRFHSLRTHVIGPRYLESICVLERMKSGRIHFHLLVVLTTDIRTGFDFAAAAAGDYRSANSELRAEWAFWRRTAKLYGFGRTELLPVKSNEEGLSKYVGKYIAKHIGNRDTRDKGVRLVRYSADAKVCGTGFAFASIRGKLWRWQVAEFARRNGCVDLDALAEKFGKRWAYWHRMAIVRIEPPPGPLREVFSLDRLTFCVSVAEKMGCAASDVVTALYENPRTVTLQV